MNILDIWNDYENKVNNAKNTKEIKGIVRALYKDDLRIDDITFNDFIYDVVIPKLRDLNITFDTENDGVIDYEEIMKENY